MSERKQQSWFVPLRVRFRSPTEQLLWEKEHAHTAANGLSENNHTLPHSMFNLPRNDESPQRTRQIKELIRLGNILRAELGLPEVLQQVVASISDCLGFRASVIKLIEEDEATLTAAAFAGISDEDIRLLQEHPMGVDQMLRLMRPEFRISQSYFISHEHAHLFADIPMAATMELENYAPGNWHPADMLMVPLFSPRKKKLLGFLSLDDPADSKVPQEESIEMIELFANQAAIAIDSARIFQEREMERVALEEAIMQLRSDLEKVQHGDLRSRVRSCHEKLDPVVEGVNSMIDEIGGILSTVQMVTEAVDEHAQDVQHSSELLVRDTSQQERQIQQISHFVDEMATTMQRVSARAAKVSQVAVEAMDVNLEGQNQVLRATEGMRQVRESTMQSSRIMKRLGESGQEINDTVLEITDLTTRMNLLALNAAIEAVRAGEQGQGFVLIAQEIRSLAVHSAEAARKVATRLRTIQHETATVAQSVEQNIQQVVIQSELVTETGVALDAISVVTEQMSDLVQGICNAAESQSQGSQMVVHSLEEITRMTSEITRHMRQMEQSLGHLVELTNSLRTRVSVLRVVER